MFCTLTVTKEKCVTSLVNRETQIKITVRYYCISIRIAKIKKTPYQASVGVWMNWNPVHCWWKCKTLASNDAPAFPELGIHKKEMKNYILTKT